MQIIIEMSEETYRTIRNDNYTNVESYCGMLAIRNGTPLPKEHGKIWEENDIKRSIENEYQLVTILTGLKRVKPIIEAERGEET